MDEQQESPFRAVYFHVTDGAQSEMLGGTPMLYVGITYHISRAEIEKAQLVFMETHDPMQAQQVVAHSDVDPNSLLRHVLESGYQPLPDAILERFDTVDSDTGDILVLLRVPCTIAMGNIGDQSNMA